MDGRCRLALRIDGRVSGKAPRERESAGADACLTQYHLPLSPHSATNTYPRLLSHSHLQPSDPHHLLLFLLPLLFLLLVCPRRLDDRPNRHRRAVVRSTRDARRFHHRCFGCQYANTSYAEPCATVDYKTRFNIDLSFARTQEAAEKPTLEPHSTFYPFVSHILRETKVNV